MSNGSSTLPPAAESAAAVLAAAGGRWEVLARHSHTSVSYTHLTLPTTYPVSISVVTVSLKKK